MTSAGTSGNGRFTLSGAFRALGNRNFRLFWSGQVVSLTGTWMQMVAQSWLVYRLTDSALLLGLTSFLQRAPMFFLSIPAGVVADRLPKRSLVIGTQLLAMLQAGVMAWLTLSGRITITEVLVLSTLLGLIYSLDMPSRQAFIGEMVGPSDLGSAIALNSTAVNAARIVGPALAGVLVAAIGEGLCFLVNCLSYLAVLAGLLMMRVPRAAPGPWSGFRREMFAGLRYVRDTKCVLYPLLAVAAVSFFGMPYVVLMPIMAQDVLMRGSQGLGLLMAAAGVGALIGAFVLAGQPDARRLPRMIALAALLMGFGLTGFGLSRSFALSMAMMLGVGMCLMMVTASTNTYLQSVVPDKLRGRLMSAYAMVFLGVVPFGGLAAGTSAHLIGAPLTIAICGGLTMLLSLPLGRAIQRHCRLA
ncbi:MAG: MFS transporter [Candidatus Alcyoniella australis]|nr:MFS transporter [Candidatus Alcyoniella australis]